MPRPFEISHVISMGVFQILSYLKNAPLDIDETYYKNRTQLAGLPDGIHKSGKIRVLMPRPFEISHVISMGVFQILSYLKNAPLDIDETYYKNRTH